MNKWEPIADMGTIRSGCCAATGADNCFYVMGGYDGTTRLNSCEYTHNPQDNLTPRGSSDRLLVIAGEFYDPVTEEWTDGPQMVKRRSGADAATGPDGSVYVVGGTDGIMQHSSVERVCTQATIITTPCQGASYLVLSHSQPGHQPVGIQTMSPSDRLLCCVVSACNDFNYATCYS